MPAVGIPRAERAPAGLPPIGDPPAEVARRPAMWIAVVLAMLVGGLVGYLFGWRLGPTETTTVMTPVTSTVPPPAYATGEFGAVVTFDGGACMYNGPAEQPAGTKVHLAFTGVKGSALVLWRVEPGATYEDVVKDAFMFGAGVFGDRGPFVSSPAGARHQELNRVLNEGLWLVGCTRHPTSARQVFTATMVRVAPRL